MEAATTCPPLQEFHECVRSVVGLNEASCGPLLGTQLCCHPWMQLLVLGERTYTTASQGIDLPTRLP